jgi:cytochrome c oxidase subunit I+III
MNADPLPHGLPNDLPRPADELPQLERAWQPPRGWRLIKSVNNSHVGLFYIATALIFLVLGGALALLMRSQLAWPENTLVSAHLYNQLFTMHGTVMMFLFAVPVVEAVAVYLLPNMLGARDLPFPRLSAYAFWAYAFGGFAFFATIFFDVAPDGGWFMYPPLTGKAYSPGLGADFWLLGIGFIEISAIAGAIELIVGILFTRAPGMTLARMPVFAWAMLVSAAMIVFAFPAIIAGTALLELERAFDWPFFIADRGGDPLLWQHLFWFFGHPEVYIIFLPAAGLVSMMVPVLARTPLVGRRWVVAALIGVGVFSFALWAHHMFTAGLPLLPLSIVSAASMAIAVPSAVQMFAWIATWWRGRLQWTVATWFVAAFFALFAIGGLTGVMLAALPFDRQAHDSYFVVAHLHYVLIGGMLFPLFAALYHWLPLVNGHTLGERVGRWVVGLMFAGFNLAFFPMHVAGLLGMPRRVATYAPELGWTGWNLVSTIGAFVFAAGIVLFAIDLVRTLLRESREHGDPWQAASLEWLPTGNYGARSIAEVRSAEPLWDQPQLHDEVPQGAHWLPGTASGGRETLITAARDARPSHLIRLPGDSWLPVLAAAGTAGFFLLLTVGASVAAWSCGIVAIAATLAWLWALDPAPFAERVEIGRGVWVPVGANGVRSHAWWGCLVLLVVDLTIAASMWFAHLHVSLLAEICPPPGAQLPDASLGAVAAALLLLGSAGLALAQRGVARGRRRAAVALALVVATAASIASFVLSWQAHQHAGLNPRADAWSATVGALLGNQGLHVLLLLFIGGFMLARLAAGKLHAKQRSGLDACALVWHGVTLQGLLLIGLVPLLPRWLNP